MKRVFIALFACAVVLFTGCIDREFDIADTSGEVTVGGKELLLPLGDIDKIKLDSLLGNNQTFTTDENGIYQIQFSSYGDDPTKYEKVSIEGISIPNLTNLAPQLEPIDFSFGSLPSSLLFSAIEQPFPIDYPTTIGDVMAQNSQTLADTIAAPTALGEEISHKSIRSLRQGIGLNDKFLMIRDLFDGDGDAYEQTINALDEFDDFDSDEEFFKGQEPDGDFE